LKVCAIGEINVDVMSSFHDTLAALFGRRA
jgi:hypothetical protein